MKERRRPSEDSIAMLMTSSASLETRRSLLSRLRDREDRDSWQTFFDLYWRLLYNVARRAGLDDPDAQDAVQDTVIAVAKEMPQFRYDPERGSFKQWLLSIVRRRVADHLRRRYRQLARAEAIEAEDDPIAPDNADVIDEAWEQEWKRSVLDSAITLVRNQANPKHFQVFDYCVLKEWPASKVAETLGMNIAQVYLAKHRIGKAVQAAARRIEATRLQGRLG
jgi:RNA polymerase sigma factor (sigma-70 family)